MNAVGSVVTFIVFLVLLLTKFRDGAWIVAVLIPVLVYTFYSIKRHYACVARSLRMQETETNQVADVANVVIIPIADLHRGSLLAMQYASRLSDDVRVVTIATTPDEKERFMEHWQRQSQITEKIKLDLVEYDYRDVLTPIVQYIEQINRLEFPNQITTVVIPEFIPERFFARFLHNQTATRLRWLLRAHKDIVIIEVPFQIETR